MKDLPGPTIEPDPDGGYKPAPRVFLWAGIGLAFVWVMFLINHTPDWYSFSVGALSAGMFVAWVTEITGNKVPDFMKPSRRVHPWPPRHWRR